MAAAVSSLETTGHHARPGHNNATSSSARWHAMLGDWNVGPLAAWGVLRQGPMEAFEADLAPKGSAPADWLDLPRGQDLMGSQSGDVARGGRALELRGCALRSLAGMGSGLQNI